MKVLIWSDFVCPFCNVARERADWLRREAGAEIDWLPFDLHPEYPPEGIPRADLLRRYGQAFTEAVRRLNEEAGLVYNPHPETVPNTRRALELTEWAREQGAHDVLHERVMDAYWTDGRDIGDWKVLEACVADAGLDPAEARAAVEAGAHRAAVDSSGEVARRNGIAAVPAFVVGGRVLVSGAQPHEVLQSAVDKARALVAADS